MGTEMPTKRPLRVACEGLWKMYVWIPRKEVPPRWLLLPRRAQRKSRAEQPFPNGALRKRHPWETPARNPVFLHPSQAL